jgi:ABC-type lipoprotein release transport system permease subunit
VGLLVAGGGARVLEGLLFEVQPLEPGAYLGTSLLLLLAAASASYLPAITAATVEPMEAVRGEG